MKQILSGLLTLALVGCSSLIPLAKVEHTSHITQHFGSNRTNYGWNTAGLGVRINITKGCTADVIDSYSFEQVDGRHEVFSASMVCVLGR